jgi:hypothetical protein
MEHVVLTANELVTRAVRHSMPYVVLSVTFEGDAVLVEVDDPRAGGRPRGGGDPFGRPTPEGDCSLQIVEGLAHSWGVSPPGTRDRAWARVSTHHEAPGLLSRQKGTVQGLRPRPRRSRS